MRNLPMSSAQLNELEKITQATLDLMKDATTTGFTTSDGLTGFGLEPVAKLLYPLATPFRNSLPRKMAGAGADAARWKAIVGFGYKKQKPTLGFGYPGSLVQTVEQDFVAPYMPLALGDTVIMDAQALARGYDNLRAKSGVKTLYELMTGEDVIALGGQAFALETPSTPTAVVSTTGGTITNTATTAKTWKFAVAVRTIEGVEYGDPTVAGSAMSTAASATVSASIAASATTDSVTLTVPFVRGAFIYDWYCDNGLGGSLFYLGSSVTNTYIATAAANTSNPVAPTTDDSADANSFNGYAATLVGDYTNTGLVKHGTGTRSSGANISSLDGQALTAANGSIPEIDAVLLDYAETYHMSPTRMLVNPQQGLDITDKLFSQGNFRIDLSPGLNNQAGSLYGGVFIENYINKAWNGHAIKIEVDPHIPKGHILGVTDVLPFPDNTIDSVLSIETQQEFQQVEYAMSRLSGAGGGPRYDYEIRAIEVLKNYFPAGGFIMHNIAAG